AVTPGSAVLMRSSALSPSPRAFLVGGSGSNPPLRSCRIGPGTVNGRDGLIRRRVEPRSPRRADPARRKGRINEGSGHGARTADARTGRGIGMSIGAGLGAGTAAGIGL